jgi:hypothetical protein
VRLGIIEFFVSRTSAYGFSVACAAYSRYIYGRVLCLKGMMMLRVIILNVLFLSATCLSAAAQSRTCNQIDEVQQNRCQLEGAIISKNSQSCLRVTARRTAKGFKV